MRRTEVSTLHCALVMLAVAGCIDPSLRSGCPREFMGPFFRRHGLSEKNPRPSEAWTGHPRE
jgi:hypothetical protein